MDPELPKKLYDLDAGPKFSRLTDSQIKEQFLSPGRNAVDMDRLYHIYLRNGFSALCDEVCSDIPVPIDDNPYVKQDLCSGIWIKPSFFNNK